MMVYGDPQYRISSRVFLRNFAERVRRARPNNVDDLRALLIQAGQFEQGMADAGQNAGGLTDVAAQAFRDALKGQTADLSRLSAIEEGPDVTLMIKITEG